MLATESLSSGCLALHFPGRSGIYPAATASRIAAFTRGTASVRGRHADREENVHTLCGNNGKSGRGFYGLTGLACAADLVDLAFTRLAP